MSNIEKDKKTIRYMTEFYCRHHLQQETLSQQYQLLIDYACQRLDHCRFAELKPSCKDCPIHCYRPEMRDLIRQVMRWSGPRMLFVAPLATLRHMTQCLIRKRQTKGITPPDT